MESVSLEDTLADLDYELVEDSWDEHGRRTYLNNDDVTRSHLADLEKVLRRLGWAKDLNALRTYRHENTGQIIEVEPGGSDTSGHLLHYMKEQ